MINAATSRAAAIRLLVGSIAASAQATIDAENQYPAVGAITTRFGSNCA